MLIAHGRAEVRPLCSKDLERDAEGSERERKLFKAASEQKVKKKEEGWSAVAATAAASEDALRRPKVRLSSRQRSQHALRFQKFFP